MDKAPPTWLFTASNSLWQAFIKFNHKKHFSVITWLVKNICKWFDMGPIKNQPWKQDETRLVVVLFFLRFLQASSFRAATSFVLSRRTERTLSAKIQKKCCNVGYNYLKTTDGWRQIKASLVYILPSYSLQSNNKICFNYLLKLRIPIS